MHKSHNPPGVPSSASRYSQAVEVSQPARWLHISGQVGMTPEGKLVADAEGQHEQVWRNLLALLAAAGMDQRNLVKVTGYVTSPEQVPLFRRVRDRVLTEAKPASTLVVISALVDPAMLVEIEAVAAA